MDEKIYSPEVDVLPKIPQTDAPTGVGGHIIDFVQTLVVFGAIFAIIYLFISQPHRVSGNSMLPYIQNNNYILTDKLSYRFGEPKVGDIIVLKNPRNESEDFIKRIMAVPGDRLKVEGGRVYLNGEVLNENYLPVDRVTSSRSFFQEGKEIEAEPNQYFVFGDNRDHSSDSRDWGAVTRQEIKGKVFFRYFPLDKFGVIQSASFSLK